MTDAAGSLPRRQWLKQASAELKKQSLPDPVWEASLLLARCLGISRLQLLANQEEALDGAERQRAEEWLRRYLSGEPLAYLEGEAHFYGRPFVVNSSVLVPRADSECLVEMVLTALGLPEQSWVCDLGTGSGCLLLTLLAEQPHWRGIGVDYSRQALEVARSNARRHHLEDRVDWLQSSWLQGLQLPPGPGLVISNPPYVVAGEEMGHGVAEYEPDLALFVPEQDPLQAYRAILQSCAKPEAKGGLARSAHLLFEIGAGRGEELIALAKAHGFRLLKRASDLGGVERALLFAREEQA